MNIVSHLSHYGLLWLWVIESSTMQLFKKRMKRSNDWMMLLASKIFILSIEKVTGRVRNTSMSVFIVLLCCVCLEFGSATDTITASQPIKDPYYITSNGSAFNLGFFSPENSTNRYVGIWHKSISVFTVVWVANRQQLLRASTAAVA